MVIIYHVRRTAVSSTYKLSHFLLPSHFIDEEAEELKGYLKVVSNLDIEGRLYLGIPIFGIKLHLYLWFHLISMATIRILQFYNGKETPFTE